MLSKLEVFFDAILREEFLCRNGQKNDESTNVLRRKMMFSQKGTIKFILSDRTVAGQEQDRTARQKGDGGKSSDHNGDLEYPGFSVTHARPESLVKGATVLRGSMAQLKPSPLIRP